MSFPEKHHPLRNPTPLKYKWDLQNSIDTYLEQGREEGEIEAKKKMIPRILKTGKMSIEEIVQISGFPVAQVQEIAKRM